MLQAGVASSVGSSFLNHFAALRDPRQSWKVVYPLPEVLLTVRSGTLAGAEDVVDIQRWAVLHVDVLRRFLPFASGIPSHDTLNDVMNAIDAELFGTRFTHGVSSLEGIAADPEAGPEVVVIDDKTSRRTHDRTQDRNPLHLASARASGQRLVLGQQACAAKSDEITDIPLLLDRLAIRGALITIDAMGCQTRIAQKILDKDADDLLAVKDNWPNLHAEIARAFDPETTRQPIHDTLDGDHGRIEQRHHAVSHDVAVLRIDRRFPGEPRFPGRKAIAMVETEVRGFAHFAWMAANCHGSVTARVPDPSMDGTPVPFAISECPIGSASARARRSGWSGGRWRSFSARRRSELAGDR